MIVLKRPKTNILLWGISIELYTVFADTQSLPNCRSNVNSKVNTITAAPPRITTGLNTPYMTICDNRWSYWG